jgi:integrase
MEFPRLVRPLQVLILVEYRSLFSENQRKDGRGLFRKILSKEGRMVLSDQVIGKKTLSKVGVFFAGLLGLYDPETYTGHCWRRTCITLLAKSNLSVARMKLVSGHKSDTVLQMYIDSTSR